MVAELVMPQLGLTMTEGKVLQWYKAAGDHITTGEPLFEVETDKVNMDVEATEAGTLLEIVAPVGQPLPVGTVIARYLTEGEVLPGMEKQPTEPSPERTGRDRSAEVKGVAASAPEPQMPPGTRAFASPRARRQARTLGVDLAGVIGTGPGGRITAQDIERMVPILTQTPPAVSAVSPSLDPTQTAAAAPVSRPPAFRPLSKIRRATAERMTASFQSAPHCYLTREVDGFDLLNLKRTLSMAAAKRRLHGISVTDMLLKALGLAIVEHPEVNVSWEDGQIRVHEDVTIGLAVAVEDGLLVPTLADVDHLSLLEIARRRRDLVDRARLGQLRSGDLRAASLTLSNLGMYGIDQFHAILNPPESLILATGRIKDRLVVAGGNAVVRPTLWCTLSVDHRALDGTQVARFFDSLAVILENPGLLLLGGSEDQVEKQA